MNYTRSLDHPRARAYYESTFAEAAALDGDHTAAIKALSSSQTHIERTAGTPPGESWASHFSIGRWAYASGMILARMGDLTAAQEHLHQALEAYGLDRRRTRASVLGNLGEIHLRQGDLDGALSAWSEFGDCGVSAALHEGLPIEDSGRLANGNLAEYLVPVNADIPAIDVHLLDHPDLNHNPAGVRGAGDIGIVGVAAAVGNAVYNATGKRIRDLPITVEKLL